MNDDMNDDTELSNFVVAEDNKMKKISKIRKVTKVFTIIAATLSIGILLFSAYNIYLWYMDNKETEKQTNMTIDVTEITEVPEENTETVNPPEDTFDPYWDYIKIPLISVDFNELLSINNQTVGWVFVDGTNINYPVVQTTNNEFYLNHTFDKSWNDAGWVFMDYRNSSDSFSQNTVIYGHSRYDKSMFGSLRNITRNNWFNDTDNHIIKFSTPTENTLWQVFSVYTIPAESYYITTDFGSDESYKTWLDTMVSRSAFNFSTSVNTNDKVITLSSCYTSDGIRVVLHAKLIKKEAR